MKVYNKFVLISVIIFFIVPHITLPQKSGWFWQNSLPQGELLNDIIALNENKTLAIPQINSVQFIDLNTGWTVGGNWTIIHTTSGGDSFIEENGFDEIPNNYVLSQNYPNPFNPSTTIKLAVPKESRVNLSIYNILGELVSTLVNEQMKLGCCEYEFNASNFSSGVYLYRINAGDFC
jgi:Secretion system C-terminal sorting domain